MSPPIFSTSRGLGHAAFHAPVLDGSAGSSTYRGRQMSGTEVHCFRGVAEGQGPAEALLDHREHLVRRPVASPCSSSAWPAARRVALTSSSTSWATTTSR